MRENINKSLAIHHICQTFPLSNLNDILTSYNGTHYELHAYNIHYISKSL